MRPIPVPELLNVWERGLTALPYERALTILSAACPESSRDELAQLSIGRRDARLLQLREWAFGADLVILTVCPSCQQVLELSIPAAGLRAVEPAKETEGAFTADNFSIRYRAPNTEDLASCAGMEFEASRRKLLTRCVIDSRYYELPIPVEELSEAIRSKIAAELAAADPQADMRLELTCPDCHNCWSEVFDIVSFFWSEIDAWARRTFREIDALARVYGWGEKEILALTTARRQIYLAMAQA